MVPDHSCGPPTIGILWNLSSSDHLKDRLARDTLEQLTDLVLSPLSGAGGPPLIQQNASEAEIFYNATGFLRCAGWPWGPEVPGSRWSLWVGGAGAPGEADGPSKAEVLTHSGVGHQVFPPSQMSTDWGLQAQISLNQGLDLTFLTCPHPRQFEEWMRVGVQKCGSNSVPQGPGAGGAGGGPRAGREGISAQGLSLGFSSLWDGLCWRIPVGWLCLGSLCGPLICLHLQEPQLRLPGHPPEDA